MRAHHEIELKRLLVGRNAAAKFLDALGGRVERETRQVNHLFDTKDGALSRARLALRLRTEDGTAFLTAKGPTRHVGRDTGSKLEAETQIDRRLARGILAGRADPLATLRRRLGAAYATLWRAFERACAGRRVRPIGRFENCRRRVRATLPSRRRITVEIDHTRFPGGRVDHELEIELPDAAAASEVERWVRANMREAGIRAKKATPKVARFYASRRHART
jgi:uncharacterized protein YjbK